MVFAAGFFLITPHYREEPKRSEVKRYLGSLGFELYETGKPAFIVYYIEIDTDNFKELEKRIKMAEGHDGVAKAYINYGFTAGEDVHRWINEALERGELELDQSTIDYIKTILAKLERG